MLVTPFHLSQIDFIRFLYYDYIKNENQNKYAHESAMLKYRLYTYFKESVA